MGELVFFYFEGLNLIFVVNLNYLENLFYYFILGILLYVKSKNEVFYLNFKN